MPLLWSLIFAAKKEKNVFRKKNVVSYNCVYLTTLYSDLTKINKTIKLTVGFYVHTLRESHVDN